MSKRVFHCDIGKIYSHEETPEGFLRVWLTVSRVGNLTYRNDNNTERIEYVPAETLFDKKSLDSVWGKPITLFHPSDRKVTSQNANKFMRGMTQQGMLINGDFLTVVGVLTDQEAIDAVKSGRANKVSAGYTTWLEKRDDGTYVQRDRSYNHFALCSSPRAGDEVRVHLDEDTDTDTDTGLGWRCDAIADTEELTEADIMPRKYKKQYRQDDPAMDVEEDEDEHNDEDDEGDEDKDKSEDEYEDEYVQLTIGNNSYLVDPELAEDILGIQEHADSIASEYNDLHSEKVRLDGELAALRVRVDEFDEDDEAIEEEINEYIAEEIKDRLDCWAIVLPALRQDDDKFQPDYKLSADEIRRLYLSKVRPELKLDDKDAAYVEGVWEGFRTDRGSDAAIAQARADAGLARIEAFNLGSSRRQDSYETEIEKAKRERAAQIAGNSNKKAIKEL